MAPPSLTEYLKKYESGYEEEKTKKAKPDVTGSLIIVDDDPVWQKSVKIGNGNLIFFLKKLFCIILYFIIAN